jgi:hypothetical protein
VRTLSRLACALNLFAGLAWLGLARLGSALAGLCWAGLGWAGLHHAESSGSHHDQSPCCCALNAAHFIASGRAGCRGQLKATDMLHDEEAGVSVQVCCCIVEG